MRPSRCWGTVPAVGLLLFAVMPVHAENKDYKKAMERVTIVVEPAVREHAAKDKNWKGVMDWLENRANWEKMFRRIDEQVGIYWKDGVSIRATLTAKNTYPVQGTGKPLGGGKGSLEISVPAVVQFNGIMKADLARVVEIFATHEITHCLQQSAKGELIMVMDRWPGWLTEGMACFAAEDDLQDQYLKLKLPINDLDQVKGNEAYPSGRLFFKYVHETYGAAKVVELSAMLFKRVPYRQAIEKVTQVKWDAFKAAELKWARDYAKKKTG